MFREDLFYRIHVIRLALPSLRDRREDIPLLIEHFIAKFNRLQGKDVVGVSDEVLGRLMEHDYPGNVRELENIIEHAFVLCRGGLDRTAHLPPQRSRHVHGRDRPEHRWHDARSDGASSHRRRLAAKWRQPYGRGQQLGIDPSTLFRKVKALGIELPEVDGRSR